MAKKHILKRKGWRIELGLEMDRTISLPEFNEVLNFLEDCSKENKGLDNCNVSLKLFDESQRPFFKLKSTDGSGTNRKVIGLKRVIQRKFSIFEE